MPERIPDEAIVVRRVPPRTEDFKDFFDDQGVPSTSNYKLKMDEEGLSAFVGKTDEYVLSRPDALADSSLVRARVGTIRAAVDGSKQRNSLALDVVWDEDKGGPGHVLIVGPTIGKMTPGASKAMRSIFKRELPEG